MFTAVPVVAAMSPVQADEGFTIIPAVTFFQNGFHWILTQLMLSLDCGAVIL